MSNYNEQKIAGVLFNRTSHIFTNVGARQVKGMCNFQVEAQKQMNEDAPIIRDVYFTTPTEELHLLTYNEIVSKWSQQLAQDIDEWTENGSRFIIMKIIRVYCTLITHKSRFGGYKKDLPNAFYKHGKVLNVINTPAEATDCLKTCINIATEGYTEKEKTTDRLRAEKGILVDYNTIETIPDVEDAFSIYESPIPIHDIPPLAKNLHTKFNILKLHNVGNNKFEISTLYIDGSATHNILFFNNHFYYINDLDKLMTFVTKRRRDQRELCINCLHYFDKRYISLDRLQCKLGKGSIIRYPKDGQVKEYNQYNFQADLEATNSSNTTIPSTPSSEVRKIHRVNSYAFFLHIDPDLDNSPYEEFS